MAYFIKLVCSNEDYGLNFDLFMEKSNLLPEALYGEKRGQ